MLLELLVYSGQRLLYQPIGRTGARTDSGWYLGKGEPMEVIKHDQATGQLRVSCPLLRGAKAWLQPERVLVDLGDEYGKIPVYGLPAAYSDITTVYSGQVKRQPARASSERLRAFA